ncbi:hypothetical protein [Virgibacillus sp. L01]|uniref:hypothetical protein n=1 Tax=Virgibacillus sp. L01 TaxID=3457429 RepID=UPI003FD36733
MNMDNKALLKLGQKHSKWLESTNINLNAYKINNDSFFFVLYRGKWSTNIKGYAVISPDTDDREMALKALPPHVYYSVTENNIKDGAEMRVNLDFTIQKKLIGYLKSILDKGVLEGNNEKIYRRAYDTLNSMIELQDEMVRVWNEAEQIMNYVDEKGYFTDEEIERLIPYNIAINLIQYKQLKPRYEYCNDFDVIYQNRNSVKQYGTPIPDRMLKEMTSAVAEGELERSLDYLAGNTVVNNYSYDEIYDKWLAKFRRNLDELVEKDKKQLRFP